MKDRWETAYIYKYGTELEPFCDPLKGSFVTVSVSKDRQWITGFCA